MGVGENLEAAKQRAEELKMTFKDYQNVLKGINEGLGVKRSAIGDAVKEYNTLIGVARQFSAVEEGILDLSDKQLQQAYEKSTQALSQLNLAAQNLTAAEKTTDAGKELLAAQKSGFEFASGTVEKVEYELTVRNKVNTAMGVMGGLMEGIADATGAFGRALNIDKVVAGMKKFADEQIRAEGSVSRTSVMMEGLKMSVAELANTLTDPAVILGSILQSIGEMETSMKEFRKTTGQNIPIADTLNTKLVTSTEYVKVATELSKELGLNMSNILSPDDISQLATLTENMGLSVEAAGRFAMISKMNGKNIKDMEKNMESTFINFQKTNKTGLNFGQVMDGVKDVSMATSLSLGNSEEAIVEAVMAAQELGLSMDKVEGIASSLLDFESSIAAELEAELLTGKSINLEKAREYALNNDIAGLTKEIGKNQAVLSAFSSGNRIQQEAVAKAMGMSREDVAKMIYMQKIQGGMSEEEAARQADISIDEAKRLSTQEQLTKSMDKIKQLAASILYPITQILDNTTAMAIVAGVIGTIMITKIAKGAKSAAKDVLSMGKGMKDFATSAVKGDKAGMKKALGFGDQGEKVKPPKKGATKQAGKGVEGFLKGLTNGLKYMGKNIGGVIKGALALGIIGIVMAGSFAIAMMMLKDVDPVQMIAFSGSLAILGITMAIMGNIAGNIIVGAAAMLILALALIPAAFAFSLLEGVDIGKMFAFSLALPLLALAAAGLGFLAPFIMWGAAALAVLGLAMIPAAYAFSLLKDVDLTAFTEAMTGLVGGPIIAGMFKLGAALGAVGFAIKKFALSMAIMSVFGGIQSLFGGGPLAQIRELALLADPLSSTANALMRMSVALKGVGSAISSIDASTLKTLERFAAKSAIASAAQGITAAITAPIQAIGGMFGGGKEKREHQELMDKLDRLIAATEQGKIIEMDGQKVGKSVAMNSSRMG